MDIFRVEHVKGGFGPYQTWMHHEAMYRGDVPEYVADRCKELASRMNSSHSDLYRDHPTPQMDKPVNSRAVKNFRSPRAWEVCGFDSIEAAKTWFDGWTKALARHGYILVHYKVHGNAVKQYERQAVFNKNRAVRVGTINLRTL